MTNEEINKLLEALNAAGLTVTIKDPQPYAPYTRMELWQQLQEAKASTDAIEKAYYQALRERDEYKDRFYNCNAMLGDGMDEIKAQRDEALKEVENLMAEKAKMFNHLTSKAREEAQAYQDKLICLRQKANAMEENYRNCARFTTSIVKKNEALEEKVEDLKGQIEAIKAQLRAANRQLVEQNAELKAANSSLADAAIDHSPEPQGSDLIGRIVEINIFHYREKNQGTIIKYEPCKDLYCVEFCDADTAWYDRDRFKILPKEQ